MWIYSNKELSFDDLSMQKEMLQNDFVQGTILFFQQGTKCNTSEKTGDPNSFFIVYRRVSLSFVSR
jgi:hypothetical protein